MKINKIILSMAVLILMATTTFATDSDQVTEKHQQLVKKFAYILNDQWGIDAHTVSGDSFFLRDNDVDSLDIIELVMSLEDYFDISIGDEEWDQVTTVDSAVDLIIDIQDSRGW